MRTGHSAPTCQPWAESCCCILFCACKRLSCTGELGAAQVHAQHLLLTYLQRACKAQSNAAAVLQLCLQLLGVPVQGSVTAALYREASSTEQPRDLQMRVRVLCFAVLCRQRA